MSDGTWHDHGCSKTSQHAITTSFHPGIREGGQFPGLGTTYTDYGNAVVGAGTEYSNLNVDGVIFFDVDVTDTSITISFLPSFSGFNFSSFNGLYITDLNNVFPSLSVASVLANGFTFLNSDVIFGPNGFGLDFQGDSFQGGESVTVNFASSVAAVPLPASLPFLAGGILLLAAMRRKQRV